MNILPIICPRLFSSFFICRQAVHYYRLQFFCLYRNPVFVRWNSLTFFVSNSFKRQNPFLLEPLSSVYLLTTPRIKDCSNKTSYTRRQQDVPARGLSSLSSCSCWWEEIKELGGEGGESLPADELHWKTITVRYVYNKGWLMNIFY